SEQTRTQPSHAQQEQGQNQQHEPAQQQRRQEQNQRHAQQGQTTEQRRPQPERAQRQQDNGRQDHPHKKRPATKRQETNSRAVLRKGSGCSIAPGRSIVRNTGIPITATGSSVADTVAIACRTSDSADTLAPNTGFASTVSLF